MLLLLVLLAPPDVPPLPKQESATLKVRQDDVSWGGVHYAGECHVSTDAGTARLPGRGLPLVDHVLELDGGWAVVGFNSTGGGPVAPSVRVVKQPLTVGALLSWFANREEPCILIQKTDAGWRVGLPKGRYEHGLRIEKKDLKPAFVDFVATETTWSYCPPSRKPLPAPKQVAWYGVSAEGFQAAP